MSKVLAFSPRLNYVLPFFILSRLFILTSSYQFIGGAQIYLESPGSSLIFTLGALILGLLSISSNFIEPFAALSLLMVAVDCLILYLIYRYAKTYLGFSNAESSYLILFYTALGLSFPHLYYNRIEITVGLLMVAVLYLAKGKPSLLLIIATSLILMTTGLELGIANIESLVGNIIMIIDKAGYNTNEINYESGIFFVHLNSLISIIFSLVFIKVSIATYFISQKRIVESINLLLLLILSYMILSPNASSLTLIIAIPIISIFMARSDSRVLMLSIAAIYLSNFISSQFDYFAIASKSNLAIFALSIKHIALMVTIAIITKDNLINGKSKN